MKSVIGAVVAVLLFADASYGGGSVNWSDVSYLLKEQPSVGSLLADSFEISPTGIAGRFGWQYPLGGARIGPYSFTARRKVEPHDTLVVTICTLPTFFDKNGRPAPWSTAESFKEHLDFVALTAEGTPSPACNDWVDER